MMPVGKVCLFVFVWSDKEEWERWSVQVVKTRGDDGGVWRVAGSGG